MATSTPRKHHVGIKMRIRPPKRRSPLQRLKSRLYYRRNRAKLRVQRRRYLRKWRTVIKKRKLFKRFKPTWFKHPLKHKKMQKAKKFKIKVPKSIRPKNVRKVKKFVPTRKPKFRPND